MSETNTAGPPVGPYALPPLHFGYRDLEPFIDEETMRLHHDHHHRAYVDGLNRALSTHPEWYGFTIEELLSRIDELPSDIRTAVHDQGGGHANHQFFWKILTPDNGGEPHGDLAAAIDADFGSFDAFTSRFEAAGLEHVGSGWVALVAKPRQNFKLDIVTLHDQDSLLELAEPSPGIIIADLWEHAYYLAYNDRRAAWLKAFWNIVNWPYADERFTAFREGRTVVR